MKSKFLDFIFGYETSENNFENSQIAKIEKTFSKKVVCGFGASFSKKVLNSRPISFINRIRVALAQASLKAYGILMLAFGVFTMLANFADYYFRALPESPNFELITAIIFIILSIPLLFFDVPLVEALQKFKITNSLLFDVFCLRRMLVSTTRKKSEFYWPVPIIIAAAIAAIGFLFPLQIVLTVLLSLVFIALAISSPEFSLLSALLFLPLIPALPSPTLILIALVAITSVSFLLKVLLGKRLFHFEQYDAVMLLFMIFILISGIFNKGFVSFENALALIALSFSYFLFSNILVNRRLAGNAVKIIVTSSIPTAIYGIILYFISPSHPEWIDPAFQGQISARAYSTFGNPNVYAVFLIVAIIFSIILAVEKSERRYIVFFISAAILNSVALVLTWTRGAWLALILSIAAFAIIRSRRCPKTLLVPALAVPIIIPFIPASVINRITSIFNMQDSSISARLSIWRSSLRMFFENFFIGTGVGSESFTEEFLKYAEDSVTAPHSHNLFIEIGCEMGIFALLIFAFMLLIRIRHRATYAKYVRNSSVDNLCTASGTAFFALLVFGTTDYIWYNSAMYLLFWAVFGIGSATLRISKKEYDDSLLATSKEAEDYAAELTITIDKTK